MHNSFGNLLKITIFGESHGPAIGVVMDGLPAGFTVDMDAVSLEMSRRAPGRDGLSTPRREPDLPVIKSGLFEGKTTGTPLCAVIENTNTRSSDYEPSLLRPSHADYTGMVRYNGANDYRGGGHFSGRITAPLVFAGAVCRQLLQKEGILIGAHIRRMMEINDSSFDPCGLSAEVFKTIWSNEFPTIDLTAGAAMRDRIRSAKTQGDSVGGVIECGIIGIAPGLGSPFFDSMESRLSSMLFSIPAVKGVSFGAGFGFADLYGSEANDSFFFDEGGALRTRTNRNAGINGGITNGMPILFEAVIKPTPSIAKQQHTVNIREKTEEVMRVAGRHDPCIAHRAVSVVENAAAVVLLDMVLEAKTYAR